MDTSRFSPEYTEYLLRLMDAWTDGPDAVVAVKAAWDEKCRREDEERRRIARCEARAAWIRSLGSPATSA